MWRRLVEGTPFPVASTAASVTFAAVAASTSPLVLPAALLQLLPLLLLLPVTSSSLPAVGGVTIFRR